MICQDEHKGVWCCYWVENGCVADKMHSAWKCGGAELFPMFVDTWKLIGMMTREEDKALTDIAEMVIKKATPNDPQNSISRAETEQVVDFAKNYLEIRKRFDNGIFKRGDDIFEGKGEEENEPNEERDEEKRGEWV